MNGEDSVADAAGENSTGSASSLEQRFGRIKSETQHGIFYPTGYVVAAFADGESAAKSHEALVNGGFVEDDVIPFRGAEILARHNQLSAHQDGLQKLETLIAGLFGQESAYLEDYLALARAGHQFVLVCAPEDADAKSVAALVKPFHPDKLQHYLAVGIVDLV